MIKVFYHHHCIDGNACIWIFLKAFAGKPAEFFGIDFGSDYESSIFSNVQSGDDVYFLDFSPTEKVIKTVLDKGVPRIYIIDHHVPVYTLKDERISSFIDEAHCAAYNVFRYFHPNQEIPNIIKYIDVTDRTDTEAKNYYEIAAFVRSCNEDDLDESIKFYEKYRDVDEALVLAQGKNTFKEDYQRMEETLGKIHYREAEVLKGVKVLLPMLEANIYEMGAEIDYKLKQLSDSPNPEAEIPYIVFAYWYEEKFVRVNIRTNPLYYDASAVGAFIGEKFGLKAGGGHRNVAVSRFSFDQFRDTFNIRHYHEL